MSAPAEWDEQQLLVRLRAADEGAFAELVRRYQASMMRIARLHVSSDAVAEEVVQESWLGVLRALPRFEQRASLKTWLLRILVNRAMSRGEREARSLPLSSLGEPDDRGPTVSWDRFSADGAWLTPPRASALPEQRAAARELREQLAAALARLPERQRLVVALHDVEGLESAEVGAVLGLSAGNVRVMLHRGRSKLQAELSGYLERPGPRERST